MKELFFNNGKAYVVLRRISHHNVMNRDGTVIKEAFNAWKEWLGANHVLRTQTHFLYCTTVDDVEWEDVNSNVETINHS